MSKFIFKIEILANTVSLSKYSMMINEVFTEKLSSHSLHDKDCLNSASILGLNSSYFI